MKVAHMFHDADCASPRESDNLGTLCLFNRRKRLPNESGMNVEELQVFLKRVFNGVCLNVFMYEHSGVALNTHGFSCPWDSRQVGVIYATSERIAEQGLDETLAHDVLISEVEEFGRWLNGECFGWRIMDGEEEVDACSGFIGYTWAAMAAMEAGAEEVIEPQ